MRLIQAGDFTAYPDALRFVIATKDAGMLIADASSSKNAALFLRLPRQLPARHRLRDRVRPQHLPARRRPEGSNPRPLAATPQAGLVPNPPPPPGSLAPPRLPRSGTLTTENAPGCSAPHSGLTATTRSGAVCTGLASGLRRLSAHRPARIRRQHSRRHGPPPRSIYCPMQVDSAGHLIGIIAPSSQAMDLFRTDASDFPAPQQAA